MNFSEYKIKCPYLLSVEPGKEPVRVGLYDSDGPFRFWGEKQAPITFEGREAWMVYWDAGREKHEFNPLATSLLTEYVTRELGRFYTPVHGQVYILDIRGRRHCYRVWRQPPVDVLDWCAENIVTPHIVSCGIASWADVIFERTPTKKEQVLFKLRWA